VVSTGRFTGLLLLARQRDNDEDDVVDQEGEELLGSGDLPTGKTT